MATPQKFRCKVKDVIPHGDHVYTIQLAPDGIAVPRFKSGQFFHLALDPYDPAGFWPDSRVFSIASSPRERNEIQFTYSVRGPYTARMEQELATGREVWAKMPYGQFFVDAKRPAVLVAGGTGITAFTAYLADLPSSPPQEMTLLYGARRATLLVYRSLVDRCAQNLTGFKAFYFVEFHSETLPTALPGRISIRSIWQHIPDQVDSNFYLSGPPQMSDALSTQLRDMGVTGQSIHIDAWE